MPDERRFRQAGFLSGHGSVFESALPKAVKFCSGIGRAEPKVSSEPRVDRFELFGAVNGFYDVETMQS